MSKIYKFFLIINILIIPVLATIFYSYTTTLVPNFIFEFNNGWAEEIFRISCFSIPINLVCAAILILKEREEIKKSILHGLMGFMLSITVGYFIMSMGVILAYMIFGGMGL